MARLLLPLVALAWLFVETGAFFHGFDENGVSRIFKEPPVPKGVSTRNVETKTMTMQTAYHNLQSTATWEMRYMENNQYFVEGGPIFIYIGGEWTISEGWLAGGHMHDIGREMNGMLYYTEHRYYGDSFPVGINIMSDVMSSLLEAKLFDLFNLFGGHIIGLKTIFTHSDLTTWNLRFCMVQQAMNDLAEFINTVKSTVNGTENSPVFLVGASYSATMGVWMRQMYPHLVQGVWASSGPLFAKLDFEEYKEVVGYSINLVGGEACYNRIASAIAELEQMVVDGEGERITELFNLCYPLDTNDNLNVWNFFGGISNYFAGLVQYHRSGDIEGMCEDVMDHEDDLGGLLQWINGPWCLNVDYNSTVEFYRETELHKPATEASRQWFYQTCAQFGWYQTSRSDDQPFGSLFPVELYLTMCADVFDNVFNEQFLDENVAHTNAKFGGFNPAVRNVYFTQGQLDPWRPMGIQTDQNDRAPADVIPLASHCADLYSMSPYDSPEMTAVKERIRGLFYMWADEYRNETIITNV